VIVLLQHDATAETIRQLTADIRALGLEVSPIEHAKGRAYEVRGSDRGRVLELAHAPGVEAILTRRTALAGGEPLWPHFALRLSVVALSVLVVLILLSAFFPPGLGDRAEPGVSVDVTVEWYLRPMAGLLRHLPKIGGIVVLLLWLAFLAWPFLDRARTRRTAAMVRLMGVILLLFAIILALGPVS
jgi:hypothetical protein